MWRYFDKILVNFSDKRIYLNCIIRRKKKLKQNNWNPLGSSKEISVLLTEVPPCETEIYSSYLNIWIPPDCEFRCYEPRKHWRWLLNSRFDYLQQCTAPRACRVEGLSGETLHLSILVLLYRGRHALYIIEYHKNKKKVSRLIQVFMCFCMRLGSGGSRLRSEY